MKLLVSTGGPSWAVAGQDRHFASQPHGVELNHPCGLTVDGTSPSASMCPSPSRVRLRQRTARSRSEDALIRGGHPGTRCMTRLTVTGNEYGTSPSASMCPSPSRVRLRQRTARSRSEDALIRGGHPGTRCMTRLTVTGNECRRRVVRMTYEACTYRVHESTSRRLVGTYERSRLSREQLCSIWTKAIRAKRYPASSFALRKPLTLATLYIFQIGLYISVEADFSVAAYQFESKDRYLTGVYGSLVDKGCSVSKPIMYAREHTDTSSPNQMTFCKGVLCVTNANLLADFERYRYMKRAISSLPFDFNRTNPTMYCTYVRDKQNSELDYTLVTINGDEMMYESAGHEATSIYNAFKRVLPARSLEDCILGSRGNCRSEAMREVSCEATVAFDCFVFLIGCLSVVAVLLSFHPSLSSSLPFFAVTYSTQDGETDDQANACLIGHSVIGSPSPANCKCTRAHEISLLAEWSTLEMRSHIAKCRNVQF
ncbi:hypothetical protein WN48_05354 [Eufriesea mexicana]|nr:hypothetical protein WN48_05354 [Eufriesea mexicana]